MKSNDYSMMVKLAIALGLGFDCASPGEINKILEHNVRPTSIIYAVPMKTSEQMMFARESGIKHTTFDSICELKRLKQYWPDARLLIRVKLESDSVYKLGDKFGCEFHEALSLLNEAARLGMTVIGVAYHVGSGCFSKESYWNGLQIARALFDHEAREGRRMSILDIGGGFFSDDTDMFDQVADLINTGLEEWFPDPDIQIIAEPGRYLCETAFTLYSNIRNIQTVNYSDKPMNMVYLSNGTHGSLQFIEKWHTMGKFKKTKDIGKIKNLPRDTIIWGPTLDDNDFLGPMKLTPCSSNDWLVFYQQGAYCKTFATNYCGMEEVHTRSVLSIELWNMIKNNQAFPPSSFVMDLGVPTVLPATLPPIIPDDGKFVETDNYTILE